MTSNLTEKEFLIQKMQDVIASFEQGDITHQEASRIIIIFANALSKVPNESHI